MSATLNPVHNIGFSDADSFIGTRCGRYSTCPAGPISASRPRGVATSRPSPSGSIAPPRLGNASSSTTSTCTSYRCVATSELSEGVIAAPTARSRAPCAQPGFRTNTAEMRTAARARTDLFGAQPLFLFNLFLCPERDILSPWQANVSAPIARWIRLAASFPRAKRRQADAATGINLAAAADRP